MISSITQTITALTTFPNRPAYSTASAYALAVETWLNEEQVFNTELRALTVQLNTTSTDINDDAGTILADAIASEATAAAAATAASASLATLDQIRDDAAVLAGYRGAWLVGTAYIVDDTVDENGTRYVSILASTGFLPSTNADKWLPVYPYVEGIGNIMNPVVHMPLLNNTNMVVGDSTVSFLRSTTATYFDRYNELQGASINEARFEKEGYLTEYTKTNSHLYSEFGGGYPMGVAADWENPVTINNIDFQSRANTAVILRDTVITYSVGFVFSVFISSDGNGGLVTVRCESRGVGTRVGQIVYDFDTQSVDSSILDTGWSYNLIVITPDIVRVSLNYNETVETLGNTTVRTATYYNGGNSYYSGFQLEERDEVMTSYIPTTSSAVVRASDYLQVLDISPDFPVVDFTIVVDVDFLGWVTNSYVFGFIDDLAAVEISEFEASAGTRLAYGDTSPFQLALVLTPTRLETFTRHLYRRNVSITDYTGVSVLNIGFLKIGLAQTFGGMVGHLRNFRIYDKAATPAEMRIL